MNKFYAQHLLKETRENYNKIADDFSRTRHYIWRDFQALAQYAKPGDKVLDLGCGNGRLLDLLADKNIDYIGVDNARNLVEMAKKRYPGKDFRLADALNTSFHDGYFDEVYSLAVLHHVPSGELRLKFLEEARRVLKPGGLLILTVWNLWQWRGWKPNLKYTVLKILGLSRLDFKDVFVPWAKTYQRYFHCFTKTELRKMVEKSGFEIKEAGILKRPDKKGNNIYIIAQKPVLTK